MTRKLALFFKLSGGLILLASLLLWRSTAANAQCGDPPQKSSCIACHEKEDPVYQNGEWHGIHALKDCCTNCHGGNCRESDEKLAHKGLAAHPLDDIYTNCYACHPADYQERAARFGALLEVTPHSRPTSTPVPVGPVNENPLVILTDTLPSPAPAFPWFLVFGGAILSIAIAVGLGALIYRWRFQE